MLSREIGYRRQHNRFSILLSQLRFHLSWGQYRCLLRICQAADFKSRSTAMCSQLRSIWLTELETAIDKSFLLLEAGKVPRQELGTVVHLFGHLFCSPVTGRPADRPE